MTPNNNNEKNISVTNSEKSENSIKKSLFRKMFSLLLIVGGIALIGFWAFAHLTAEPITPPAPPVPVSAPVSSAAPASSAVSSASPAESEPQPIEFPELKFDMIYPTDKYFVTGERLDYADGDLVLRVPRLELETKVFGAVPSEQREKFSSNTMTQEERIAFMRNDNSDNLLSQGVMLFNLSPLPGKTNANVSISGHRDICGKEFYYIDTNKEGDMIYLDYKGETYHYEYLQTSIIEADNWSKIYCRDFPCITLISCDPIGTHRNRIVVTAKLVGITEKAPE